MKTQSWYFGLDDRIAQGLAYVSETDFSTPAVVSGVELIGVTSLKKYLPVCVNEKEDYFLYEEHSSFIKS